MLAVALIIWSYDLLLLLPIRLTMNEQDKIKLN
jgi:hypothetical protein